MLTLNTILPEALMADSNHFACAKAVDDFTTLAGSMANLKSYTRPTHSDESGNLYCVAGIQVSDRWKPWVQMPVTEHPAFDTGKEIDLAAVARIQAGMTIIEEAPELPYAMPKGIVLTACSAESLGLTKIPDPD